MAVQVVAWPWLNPGWCPLNRKLPSMRCCSESGHWSFGSTTCPTDCRVLLWDRRVGVFKPPPSQLWQDRCNMVQLQFKTNLISKTPLQLLGADVDPSGTVRNLGAYLVSGLTIEEQCKNIRKVSTSCYATFRVLREAWPFIPHNTLFTLVVQFVLTRLDYCNSLLTNVSDRTLHHCQNVLNASARLISGFRTSEHITPILKGLYWLKIP